MASSKSKNQIIQFIRDCYIPNNTFYSLSDLPSGWQDFIDGTCSLNYNLRVVENLLKKYDRDKDRSLMSGIDYKTGMEKRDYLVEKHFKQGN